MLLIDIAIAPNDIGEQLVEVSAAVLTNMKHEAIHGAYQNSYQQSVKNFREVRKYRPHLFRLLISTTNSAAPCGNLFGNSLLHRIPYLVKLPTFCFPFRESSRFSSYKLSS